MDLSSNPFQVLQEIEEDLEWEPDLAPDDIPRSPSTNLVLAEPARDNDRPSEDQTDLMLLADAQDISSPDNDDKSVASDDTEMTSNRIDTGTASVETTIPCVADITTQNTQITSTPLVVNNQTPTTAAIRELTAPTQSNIPANPYRQPVTLTPTTTTTVRTPRVHTIGVSPSYAAANASEPMRTASQQLNSRNKQVRRLD
jgi:hypothetical protein